MRILLATSDKRVRLNVYNLIVNTVLMRGGTVTLSGSTKSAIDEIEYREFDFIITDYLVSDIDGRRLCRQICKQKHYSGTYIMMLVGNRQIAQTDLKTYLTLSDIGKTIELLKTDEISSIPERIMELGDRNKRISLAMNGIHTVPYDNRTIMTFSTDKLPKLGSNEDSLFDMLQRRYNVSIWESIEYCIKENDGYINSGNFTAGIPIQAIFENVGKAILAWICIIRCKHHPNGCAIIEGPVTKIFGRSAQPIFNGDLFNQASQLLEIANNCQSILIAIRNFSSIENINFTFRQHKNIRDEILCRYEIYELQ